MILNNWIDIVTNKNIMGDIMVAMSTSFMRSLAVPEMQNPYTIIHHLQYCMKNNFPPCEEMYQWQGKSRVCGRTKMSFINVHTHFTALHIWPRCIMFTFILEARQGMWWGYSEDRDLVNGQDLSLLQTPDERDDKKPRQKSMFLLTKSAEERGNISISVKTSCTCHF